MVPPLVRSGRRIGTRTGRERRARMVRLACEGRCGVGKGGSPGQRTVAWRVETRRAGYNRRVDPATLQRMREQSGLRLDKEGRFWHRGGLVEHARTLAVLHQGVHRAADGRWATRIGKDWAYLEVEDAALWVRRIEPEGASLRGQLASGDWVEVDPATLAAGADDALYARVGGERARLTRDAQLSLSDHLREDDDGFLLQIGGRAFRIGKDTGP